MTTAGAPGVHLGELLSAFVDGELAPTDALAARAHLAACPQCQNELDAVMFTRRLLRDLPGRTPPAGWLMTVVARDTHVSDAVRRARARRWAATWVAVGAAAAATGMLILPAEPVVAPPVFHLVDSHAAGSSIADDPVMSLAPNAVPAGLVP